MKCGEVLDGGLLSRDPCDFKECLAHLVNQRLMRITVNPPLCYAPPITPPQPGPYCTLSFFTGGSWEDRDPQVDTQCLVGKVCVGFSCVCINES